MLPLRFGIALPTHGPFATADHVFAVATRAEDRGFDDVWVNDFYDYAADRITRSPVGSVEACRGQDPNYFEGLATLAAVGARLRRIGLAWHGINLPARSVPLFTKQISTVHALAGDRLTIAPAIGGVAKDFELMGVPKAERGKRLDEALELMTTILTSEHPVSFHGRYTDFSDVTLYPRPGTIALWITGDSDPALHRVVRFATGWFSSSAVMERFPGLTAQLDVLARQAGRDGASIVRATDIFITIADTVAEARRIADASLAHRYGSVEAGLHHAAVGDPDAVADHLVQRINLGMTCIEFRFICHTPEAHLEMIDRLASEVLPRVAQRRAEATPGTGRHF